MATLMVTQDMRRAPTVQVAIGGRQAWVRRADSDWRELDASSLQREGDYAQACGTIVKGACNHGNAVEVVLLPDITDVRIVRLPSALSARERRSFLLREASRYFRFGAEAVVCGTEPMAETVHRGRDLTLMAVAVPSRIVSAIATAVREAGASVRTIVALENLLLPVLFDRSLRNRASCGVLALDTLNVVVSRSVTGEIMFRRLGPSALVITFDELCEELGWKGERDGDVVVGPSGSRPLGELRRADVKSCCFSLPVALCRLPRSATRCIDLRPTELVAAAERARHLSWRRRAMALAAIVLCVCGGMVARDARELAQLRLARGTRAAAVQSALHVRDKRVQLETDWSYLRQCAETRLSRSADIARIAERLPNDAALESLRIEGDSARLVLVAPDGDAALTHLSSGEAGVPRRSGAVELLVAPDGSQLERLSVTLRANGVQAALTCMADSHQVRQ